MNKIIVNNLLLFVLFIIIQLFCLSFIGGLISGFCGFINLSISEELSSASERLIVLGELIIMVLLVIITVFVIVGFYKDAEWECLEEIWKEIKKKRG